MEEEREEKGGKKGRRRKEGRREAGRKGYIIHTYKVLLLSIHVHLCFFSLIPKLCSASTWPGNEVS